MTHSSQQFQFERVLREWLALYAIPTDTITFGYSSCYDTQTGFPIALREAFLLIFSLKSICSLAVIIRISRPIVY